MTGTELNAVWALKTRLDREKRRLQDLQVMAESMTPLLDGMPHAKPLTFKVEKTAMLIVTCQEKIAELTDRLIQTKFDLLINLQALNLNEMCERVLSYRYVACLTFGAIAKLMNITRDYAWKIYKRGLASLGLTLDEMNALKKATKGNNCSA